MLPWCTTLFQQILSTCDTDTESHAKTRLSGVAFATRCTHQRKCYGMSSPVQSDGSAVSVAPFGVDSPVSSLSCES